MTNEGLRQKLRHELASARAQTDKLFQMLDPAAMYERPIAERHRIIFYLGHLEAFDWNMVCRTSFEMPSFNSQFDRLFEFGIDPVDGKLPQDQPSDWPRIPDVLSYRQRTRDFVDEVLERASFRNSPQSYLENGQIFRVAVEHRLMHGETLAYMFHWLPYKMKHRETASLDVAGRGLPSRRVDIPAGEVIL